MRRIACEPRLSWEAKLDALAFSTYRPAYWREQAYYQFGMDEIETLERAAAEVHRLCLDAVTRIIEKRLLPRYGFTLAAQEVIERSWEREHPSLYGRFDMVMSADGPKLLEYNADTPTALYEAAVVQWYWQQEQFKDLDQFNSLHERLIGRWQQVKPASMHFAAVESATDDFMTVQYLMDTCAQAKIPVAFLDISDVGFNVQTDQFVDEADQHISYLFKLYPWEWMFNEAFFPYVPRSRTLFIEPAWKVLLSNKMILPLLWEFFPDHPNLLPAYIEETRFARTPYVTKPVMGREGSNVVVRGKRGEIVCQKDGIYSAQPMIYQQAVLDAYVDGYHPVLGLWIVGDEPAGMGIREDKDLVTTDTSTFIPHVIKD